MRFLLDRCTGNWTRVAVVFGAIRSRVTERLDDGHDEFPHGVVDGGAQDLFHVGNGFEGFHGGSPVVIEGVITGSAFLGRESGVARRGSRASLEGEVDGLAAYQIRYRECRSSRVRMVFMGAGDGQ